MTGLARLSMLKDKMYLNLTEETYDAELRAIILTASQIANTMTGRTLQLTTYDEELYTGNDSGQLYPENYPVVEVEAVKLWDGSSAYVTETSTYYVLVKSRYIQYPALGQETNATWSCWYSAYTNGIKLTYAAGYATTDWDALGISDSFGVPADLEHAVLLIAMKIWKDGASGGSRFGLSSISKMGDSIGVAVDKFIQGVPVEARMILDQYRAVTF